MARFDDARDSPATRVDESFSYLSMVTLTILGARAAAGLPTTAQGALRLGHCRPSGPGAKLLPLGPRRAAPEPLRLITPRYFHQQPSGLRAVRPPLTKAVYRPRQLRPVEVKVPYQLWSSTAPALGPACVASIHAA